MNATDLVFSLDENNIMSAGFNINSQLLKKQLNKKINIENEYILPIGLNISPMNREKYIPIEEEINVINGDLYDKLVEVAVKPIKSKTQRNVLKHNKKNKTKRSN